MIERVARSVGIVSEKSTFTEVEILNKTDWLKLFAFVQSIKIIFVVNVR